MVPWKEEESLCRRQSHKSPSFLMRLPLSFAFFFFPPVEFPISEGMAVGEGEAEEPLFSASWPG